MDIKEFKQYILNNNLPSLSILTGDEALLYIYLEQIYNRFTFRRLNTIEDYLKIKKSRFKLDSEDTLYLIYDDEIFKTNTSYWNIEYDHLILIYHKLDKKDKFYKAFEPKIIYLEGLDNKLLVGVIKNRVDLDDTQINYIINKCNSNYFKCLNEVNKISIFDKTEHKKLYNEFIKEELLCKTDKIDNFELVNAFTNRDKVTCIQLATKINKEDILGQLTLIYNNIKTELLVRGGNQTAEELKINPKLHYVLSKKRNFTILELCNILVFISNKLNEIKLGIIDNIDALYLILLRCL